VKVVKPVAAAQRNCALVRKSGRDRAFSHRQALVRWAVWDPGPSCSPAPERRSHCPTSRRLLRLAGIPKVGAILGLARSRHEQNAMVIGLGVQQLTDALEDNDPFGVRIAESGNQVGCQGVPGDLSAPAPSRGLGGTAIHVKAL